MSSAPRHAAVIGLGLLGGSLALALRERGWRVTGFDADEKTSERAVAAGVIDEAVTDVEAACGNAELIALAAPALAIVELLPRVGAAAANGACIIDVGSTKQRIVEAMSSLPERVRAIGGHPMTGRRTQGVTRADATLFEGRAFVLVPTARTDAVAWTLADELVSLLGARRVDLKAQEHDELVAMVSHLPQYLAVALLEATAGTGDTRHFELAAGGFRAVTASAGRDVAMWRDIGLTNGAAIAGALRQLASHCESLADLLDAGDPDALGRVLEAAADAQSRVTPAADS